MKYFYLVNSIIWLGLFIPAIYTQTIIQSLAFFFMFIIHGVMYRTYSIEETK